MTFSTIQELKSALMSWPTAVATPVHEYLESAEEIETLRPVLLGKTAALQRQRPFFLAAHRLCDGAEMITRFFACVALSDLAARGSESFGPRLQKDLMKALAQPSFGIWASFGSSAYKVLMDKHAGGFAPACAEFWRMWKDFLGSDERGAAPDRGIIAFRNDLHHRGRISETEAQRLHDLHQTRFFTELARLAFLAIYASSP